MTLPEDMKKMKYMGICKNCGHPLWLCDDDRIRHGQVSGDCRLHHSIVSKKCFECEKSYPRIAHLILKYKWYDKIDKGPKRIEYRNNTERYRKMLRDCYLVTLRRGYTKVAMLWLIDFTEFDGPQIKIHLDKRAEIFGTEEDYPRCPWLVFPVPHTGFSSGDIQCPEKLKGNNIESPFFPASQTLDIENMRLTDESPHNMISPASQELDFDAISVNGNKPKKEKE